MPIEAPITAQPHTGTPETLVLKPASFLPSFLARASSERASTGSIKSAEYKGGYVEEGNWSRLDLLGAANTV